jgi:RNA polymerase-binding transcription factor DksA
MADDADRANEFTDLELAHALAGRKLPPRGRGSPECDDCGGEIPEARQAMGYVICVECSQRRHRLGR